MVAAADKESSSEFGDLRCDLTFVVVIRLVVGDLRISDDVSGHGIDSIRDCWRTKRGRDQTPNAPVQRRTAQRAVRCNRLLGGAPVPNPYWISASEQTRLQPRLGVEHRRLGRLAERDLVGA